LVPTALEVIRGPLLAGQSLPTTFRLQGLATLLTACALESRAGFVSHRQRSWDSPFGGFLSHRHPQPFDREEPAYRWLGVYSAAQGVGPARRASVSRFIPAGIALRPHGFLSRRPLAPPLGFAPLGCYLRKPCPGLLRASSRVLCGTGRLPTGTTGTSEYRSAFASPRPTRTEVPAGRSNPCGVPAPARSRPFELPVARAIEFTSRRVMHCC